MSLHDMRQELNNYEINENETVTSEVIEEELFNENGKCNRALLNICQKWGTFRVLSFSSVSTQTTVIFDFSVGCFTN